MKLKTILSLLVIACLAISVALNYVFYKKAFIPLHALRLNPLALNYYPSTPRDSGIDQPKKTIMYYGDSRALSWPFTKNNQYKFINRAIGNQTSIQIISRFKHHVVPHTPDILLVQMCVNDLKMIPLFPEKTDQIIKDCTNNIDRLLQQAHSIGSKVILTTVFPLADISTDRKLLGTREQPIIEAIDVVNQHIKSLKSDNTLIFDSFSLLVDDDRKVDASYSHDWLHLNKAGYQHLNQHLEKFINDAR